MATQIYFCTGCGEPVPATQQFCSSCGASRDPNAPTGNTAAPTTAPARPGATVRLPDPTLSTPGGPAVAPALPPTTALPPPAQPATVRVPKARRQISRRSLALGGIGLVLVALVGVLLVRNLPFGQRGGVDRVVTLLQSRNGDTTMVLMRSDGSNKVTLVDEPGAARSNGQNNNVFVSYAMDVTEEDASQLRGYGSPGAVVLAEQSRVLFWYSTPDGVEIRSSDLDGGDIVKMVSAAPVVRIVIPQHGDKILLVEQEPKSSRLILAGLHGQSTPLLENALEVQGEIAPDGKHIAYTQRDNQGRYKLMVVDDAGANPNEVAREAQSVSMTFSSDSSKLFVARRNDKDASFLVTNADGQNPIVLSQNADGGRGEVANGRLIYQIVSNGASSLFTSSANGDDRVEIARGADRLDWRLSPDRKQIIFAQKRNERYALESSDFKHEQIQELKRSDGPIAWRSLKNGRLLVLRGSDESLSSGFTLSTMQADGSDEQVLKRDVESSGIDVQGTTIVVGGQTSGRGALLLFDGKDAQTLDDEADSYFNARFTPSGQIIYIANFRSGPVTYLVDKTGKQKKLLAEDATVVATGF